MDPITIAFMASSFLGGLGGNKQQQPQWQAPTLNMGPMSGNPGTMGGTGKNPAALAAGAAAGALEEPEDAKGQNFGQAIMNAFIKDLSAGLTNKLMGGGQQQQAQWMPTGIRM